MRDSIKYHLDKFRLLEQELSKKGGETTESNLSRVWSHVENKTPFAMVSLSRSDMSNEEKKAAFILLKEMVRNLGYGFIELKGGYVEKGDEDTPDRDVVDEMSLMVPNMSKKDAIKVGQTDLGYGPQDTVLYCDGKDFLGYIKTNSKLSNVGDIDLEFKYDSGKDALPMVRSAVEMYFSMLSKGSHRKRKFAFVPKDDIQESFVLFEMGDRRTPKYPNKDWWYNFGIRII